MLISCEECGKRYKIDPSKIKGQSARFKCNACGNLITVIKPREIDVPPPSRPPALAAVRPKSAPVQAAGKLQISGFSIKTKITLVIVLLVFVSLSIIGYIASSEGSKALSGQAESHLKIVTSQKATEYNSVFERIQDEIVGVAKYASKTFTRTDISTDLKFALLLPWTGNGYGSPELFKKHYGEILILQRIGAVLEGLVSSNPYIELGYIATDTKITSFSDEKIVGVIKDIDGYDPTGRPWYTGAKEAGKLIWTQPYVDANTKKLVVTCAVPLFRPDKTIIGVMGFDVLLATIQKDILTLDIGYNSYAFLVGKKGDVLVRPGMTEKDTRWDETYKTDNLLKTNNPTFNSIIREMIGGRRGVKSYSAEKEDKYIAFAPLKSIGASMGIVASKKEVVRPAVSIQYLILGITVIVLVIAIVIGFVIGNNLTKPIKELTTMANLISQGKMDLDVLNEDRKDEIGILTKSFNRLVISLKLAMLR